MVSDTQLRNAGIQYDFGLRRIQSLPPGVVLGIILHGRLRIVKLIRRDADQDVPQNRRGLLRGHAERIEIDHLAVDDGCRGQRGDTGGNGRRPIQVFHRPVTRIPAMIIPDHRDFVSRDPEFERALHFRIGLNDDQRNVEPVLCLERVLRPHPLRIAEKGDESALLFLQEIADVEFAPIAAGRYRQGRPQYDIHIHPVPPALVIGDKGVAEEPESPSVIQQYGIGAVSPIPAVTVGKSGDAVGPAGQG